MKAKVVDAYNDSSRETGYMIMIQESKGKKYNKGLKINGTPFYTTDKQKANQVCKDFNNNSL